MGFRDIYKLYFHVFLKRKEVIAVAIENTKNRDMLMKLMCQMYLSLLQIILDLPYEVDKVLPSEHVSFYLGDGIKIMDKFKDFVFMAKNGVIVILEFKKNKITQKDLKQCCQYFRQLFCQYTSPIQVIILGLNDEEPCREYKMNSIIFKPIIILTKKISKQEHLNNIRFKIKNNIKLSKIDAALLVTLPIFKIDDSEAEITREVCRYLKYHADLIPKDMLAGMRGAMYLNIVEYINDKKEQDYLMELIDVEGALNGVFAEIRNEVYDEVISEERKKAKKDVYEDFLRNHTIEEVSEFTGKKPSEILEIINYK